MRIIFHIGMGKTGTSSIQKALQDNPEGLARQKASYLGMWFSVLDPSLHGMDGIRTFFSASPEDLVEAADRFHALCQAKSRQSGAETFIFSNESIYELVGTAAPFLKRLAVLCDLSCVLYLRDPKSWLPSAFTQWGIWHKTVPGRIPRFQDLAPKLIALYSHARTWHEVMGDHLIVREQAKNVDVVEDFSDAIGIALDASSGRVLERAEPAELLLRALFNDRIADTALPDRFNRVVVNTNRKKVTDLAEMADRCFNMPGIDAVISTQADALDFIRNQWGIDFSNGSQSASPPDLDAIRTRMLDFLIEISLSQAISIHHLEREVRTLKESVSDKDAQD